MGTSLISFIHNNVINNYLSKLNKSSKLLYTDTTLIMNKLGIDMITNNNILIRNAAYDSSKLKKN